jgi:hypothetical protein
MADTWHLARYQENDPVAKSLRIALGTTEWLLLGVRLGLAGNDSIGTSLGVALGTTD